MASTRTPLTLDDVTDPTGRRLLTHLDSLSHQVVSLQNELAAVKSGSTPIPATSLTSQLVDQLTSHVQRQLSSTGTHPLPINNLPGAPPTIIPFTTDPTLTVNANQYAVGTLATFGAHIYYVAAGNPHTWVTII